jgi:hypothetical protein
MILTKTVLKSAVPEMVWYFLLQFYIVIFTMERLKQMAAEADVSLQHLSTDERIVDIALECGFSDPKYLILFYWGCRKTT